MNKITKFFICGLASSLLFPPFFIFPLGFIIFPYLFFLILKNKNENNNSAKNFIYGTSYGIGLNLILLVWIKEPFVFDPNSKNLWYLSIFPILYVSIFYGLSFLIINLFKNNLSKLFLFPVVFVLAEILRENISYGFPWVTYSLVSASNYYFFNLAYFIGNYGLSYLVVFIFLLPVVIFFLINKLNFLYAKIYSFYSILIISLFTILVLFRLNIENTSELTEYEISLNQLNINQIEKRISLNYEKRFEKIKERIVFNNSDLIIFSENDFPGIISEIEISKKIQPFLKDNQAVVIGGIRKESSNYYNSFYLIFKDKLTYFDKKILVPFGEFLPFRENLNFIDFITEGIDFSRGRNERLIKFDFNLNFIPVICYEIIFFNNIIKDNNFNSPLIINITNDAWFGNFSGPYQHFYLSILRSAEFNKNIIRVSNNGISAFINNHGKIINNSKLNTEDQKNFKVKLPIRLENNLRYHNYIYLYFCIIFLISIIINKKNE